MKKIIILIILFGDNIMANNEQLNFNKGVELDGAYLLAWNTAYNDFIKIDKLTKEQKYLQHYNIFFGEKENNYVIRFDGKLMSEKNIQKYNQMIFGKSVKYLINKKNLKITERLFFK